MDILQKVGLWFKKAKELKDIKAEEMVLRKELFSHFFHAPVEGTNTAPLDGAWVIKGKHTVSREIDPGELQARGPMLESRGLPLGKLVEWKPSLKLKEYRELTDEQKALFDLVLIVKDGSPALEVALPAKSRPKGYIAEQPDNTHVSTETWEVDVTVGALAAQMAYFANFPNLVVLGLMEPEFASGTLTNWNVTQQGFGPLYEQAKAIQTKGLQQINDMGTAV